MRTRALTASEATARLISLGYFPNALTTIKDNECTLPFGKSENGVFYGVQVWEDNKGNSNIFLFRFIQNDVVGCSIGVPIANYNKMKAAEKKTFMQMLETAEIL